MTIWGGRGLFEHTLFLFLMGSLWILIYFGTLHLVNLEVHVAPSYLDLDPCTFYHLLGARMREQSYQITCQVMLPLIPLGYFTIFYEWRLRSLNDTHPFVSFATRWAGLFRRLDHIPASPSEDALSKKISHQPETPDADTLIADDDDRTEVSSLAQTDTAGAIHHSKLELHPMTFDPLSSTLPVTSFVPSESTSTSMPLQGLSELEPKTHDPLRAGLPEIDLGTPESTSTPHPATIKRSPAARLFFAQRLGRTKSGDSAARSLSLDYDDDAGGSQGDEESYLVKRAASSSSTPSAGAIKAARASISSSITSFVSRQNVLQRLHSTSVTYLSQPLSLEKWRREYKQLERGCLMGRPWKLPEWIELYTDTSYWEFNRLKVWTLWGWHRKLKGNRLPPGYEVQFAHDEKHSHAEVLAEARSIDRNTECGDEAAHEVNVGEAA